ncbi:peptidase M50 [Dehalogenimonas alkenigignens]|uniref:Zinc metalloprotease n=2 Tax=Dehalogenimonas alkenigignens TaxID=1217799 RepID=A0A0W0GIS2_9CHLR|nr:site-2 protease family protein [Dehalogenimonas alkenigignens]KTB48461.1 Zn-dependent protease [Dehalogenimonas alkenigignens]PVV85088.1 peptidase M50 [Dehalogenimonas alkenigignens]
MDSAFKIGRFLDIDFRIHFSWFLIFILMAVFLARDVFPGAVRGESTLSYWLMGTGTAFLFFMSVLGHELGHTLAARSAGIPIGGITLFLFGGAAQMNREPASAGAELKMALSGPGVSLLLAALFWAAYQICLGSLNTLAAMSLWLSQINLIVAGFNLLPGFPLDGGRVLRALWWRLTGDHLRATRVSVACGRITGLAIAAAGIFVLVQNRDWLAGVWLILIGAYLEYSARLSLRQFNLQQWMKGRKVSEVMETRCREIPPETTVSELLVDPGIERCLLVKLGDRQGVVFAPTLSAHSGTAGLGRIALPVDGALQISPGDDLLVLAQQMNETGRDYAVVKQDGQTVGFVFLDALIDLVNSSRGGNT